MFDMTTKVALVAGGAGYLGVPVCRGLAEQGATVVIGDINEDRARESTAMLNRELGADRVEALFLDAADAGSIKECLAYVSKKHARLDVLVVANAFAIGKALDDLKEEELDRALHLNVTATFMMAGEAARMMTDGGSIVLFSSMYGSVSPQPRAYLPPMNPNPIEYGVSKAAIEQMTRYLAVQWAQRNIRVNAVAPGPFPWHSTQKEHPEFIARLEERVPLGRIGRREEAAGAVVFLASDEASYVTGHVLRVDGGWTAW